MMPSSRVQDKTTWDLGYTIADSIHIITYVVPFGCTMTSGHPDKYTVVAGS